MRRWFAKVTIGLYMSAMIAGIAAHAMNFGTNSHPAMYFFVWDMFCGWSAHEIRYHLIAEGESGAYYDITEGPWGTFTPYGDLSRAQYDILGNLLPKIALNILKHTDHEPISRIHVAEEVWPKKFNLPDHLWKLRFDEPKEPKSYFWVLSSLDAEGRVITSRPNFLTHLHHQTIVNNPRLQADTQRGRPFFAIDLSHRSVAFAGGESTYTGTDSVGNLETNGGPLSSN
jgi:hypothetical protein